MKKTAFILLLSLIGFSAFAQEENDTTADNTAKSGFYKTPYRTRNSGSYNKHAAQLSLSYGFPNYLYGGSYYASGYYNNGIGIGPVMLRFEKAVHDEIGVMVFGQVATKHWEDGGYKQDAFGISFGAMGIYHFNKFIPVAKLDVYAGIGVEVNHDRLTDNYYNYDTNETDFAPVGVVGARYLFSKNWSVFAEVGSTAYSYANVGITLSFWKKMHGTTLQEQKVGPGM